MRKEHIGKRCLALLMTVMLVTALCVPVFVSASVSKPDTIEQDTALLEISQDGDGMDAQTRYFIAGGIALGACAGLYLFLNLKSRKK